jgi:hypothetical protein
MSGIADGRASAHSSHTRYARVVQATSSRGAEVVLRVMVRELSVSPPE